MDAPKLRSSRTLADPEQASYADRAFEFFRFFWHEREGQSARRHIVFLACLVTLCAVTIFTGAVPTRRYGHDIFFLLENGWRILNGQRPHIDFYSAWGPVTYLVVGLGLKLSHYTVNGVGYGTAISGLIIGLWSYTLGGGRMESSPRILASVFLTALVVAPYPLGISPLVSSHAMVYNRYGYALVGLVMLEAFQPIQGMGGRTAGWVGGISSGAAAALALFLKASFFLVAIVLLMVSVLFWRRNREQLLGMVLVGCP